MIQHIVISNSYSVLKFIKKRFPFLGFATIHKLLRSGQIRVDGRRVDSQYLLSPGEKLRIPVELIDDKNNTKYISKKKLAKFANNIIYQDNNFIIINKPYGLASQGGSKINISVDDYLQNIDDKLRILHRLDKTTSGIMMVGFEHCIARLSNLFKCNYISKFYLAFIYGCPAQKEGIIDKPIIKLSNNNYQKVVVDYDKGREAKTYYTIIDSNNNVSLVLLIPQSGRMHQLRVHCADIGHSIVGDKKYGGNQIYLTNITDNIHLHAYRIMFNYDDKDWNFTTPFAQHMCDSASIFGFDLSKLYNKIDKIIYNYAKN